MSIIFLICDLKRERKFTRIKSDFLDTCIIHKILQILFYSTPKQKQLSEENIFSPRSNPSSMSDQKKTQELAEHLQEISELRKKKEKILQEVQEQKKELSKQEENQNKFEQLGAIIDQDLQKNENKKKQLKQQMRQLNKKLENETQQIKKKDNEQNKKIDKMFQSLDKKPRIQTSINQFEKQLKAVQSNQKQLIDKKKENDKNIIGSLEKQGQHHDIMQKKNQKVKKIQSRMEILIQGAASLLRHLPGIMNSVMWLMPEFASKLGLASKLGGNLIPGLNIVGGLCSAYSGYKTFKNGQDRAEKVSGIIQIASGACQISYGAAIILGGTTLAPILLGCTVVGYGLSLACEAISHFSS